MTARWRQELEDGLRGGLAWWLAELSEMLPRRRGGGRRLAPVALEIGEEQAWLRVAMDGGGAPVRVPVDPAAPEAAIAEVRTALRRAKRGDAVAVELAPALVLQTELALPRAAERALRPILLNQLDRIVPLPPDEVEFAYAVRRPDGPDRPLRVLLTVVTRDTLDRALSLAGRLRLRPQRVVAEAGPDGRPALLWQAGRQAAEPPMRRRVRHVLELGTVGLLAAAFVFYLVRLDQRLESLESTVADKARLAQAAMRLGKERDEAAAALEVVEKRRAQPSPLRILTELTELVPDDSWISRLQVQGRAVEIVGVSPNVSGLVDRLSRDPLFADPKFLSPITGTADGKAQRFDLSLVVEEGAAQ